VQQLRTSTSVNCTFVVLKKLYVIAGCNGAGKTTASNTILPDILNCKEFVNADEIARGLSPFQPDKAKIAAGRLMLSRISELLESEGNFAFETTLATRGFVRIIKKARTNKYSVTLLFLWLNSADLAVERVKTRVREGGHHIPEAVIRRRYDLGLRNFFKLYQPVVDHWMFINNSGAPYHVIAQGMGEDTEELNPKLWQNIKNKYNE